VNRRCEAPVTSIEISTRSSVRQAATRSAHSMMTRPAPPNSSSTPVAQAVGIEMVNLHAAGVFLAQNERRTDDDFTRHAIARGNRLHQARLASA
jgi:hypothetical protein